MKPVVAFRMAAIAAAWVCIAPLATMADEYDKKTIVTITQPTEAPGIVLQPGKYVIKLLNSSSNRHIAEIMNERMDHLYALTFTASAERLDRGDKNIVTFYEGGNGQPQALRKWFWPGETIGQEFLYPKNQAARISAASKQKVPEAELPTLAESGQSLSPDNANGLALQSSTESEPTPATPLAARAADVTPAAPPTVIAQNTPPPAAPTRTSDVAQADVTPPAPSTNSTDSTLPQTGSALPLIGAIGVVSLALAVVLGSVKRYRSL